jgi:RnfABCDGE-type electron transport complex G subunit
MNERLKYPLVITAICLAAAAGLALVYSVTKKPIERAKASELNKALEVVLPEGEVGPLEGHEGMYVARKDGKPVGYAATGTAQGYSSTIRVLVGVRPGLEVIAIRILEQNETPGLGERTKEIPPTKSVWQAAADLVTGAGKEAKREPPFQSQFRGKTYDQLELTKSAQDTERIHQLTGATITSSAVVTAVKRAIDKVRQAASEKPNVRAEPEH